MACVNCNTDFQGEFCPTCGERKDVDRITFSSISQTLFVGLIEMDKGFLYNIKNLTINPKKTITDYLKGKRKKIFNPISYAVITISIYLFLDSILPHEIFSSLEETSKDFKVSPLYSGGYEVGSKIGRVLVENLKYLWLLHIFYLSVFSKLFFRRFNFFEHLAINSFIVGHATLLAILCRLIIDWKIIFNIFISIYMIFLLYKVFKNPKDKFGSAVISFLIVFFSYLSFFTVSYFVAKIVL